MLELLDSVRVKAFETLAVLKVVSFFTLVFFAVKPPEKFSL